MHPRRFAESHPEKAAIVMAESGKAISYGQLEVEANRGAQLFRSLGLKAGEKVAFALENSHTLLQFAWAAQRAGLYFIALSSRLTADEIAYILADSGARLLLTSTKLGEAVDRLPQLVSGVELFMTGDTRSPYRAWDAEVARCPGTPIDDERPGIYMLYSSGTTGRPKGILPPRPTGAVIEAVEPLCGLVEHMFGGGFDTTYLCPAPLYHAAPLRWSMAIQRLGGTVVITEKFDPEAVLAAIERYRVTLAQFVPTHFVRMLNLPQAVRDKYDLASLRVAVHAAAPCPAPIKAQMIEWWGPIVCEYYAGSEGNGMTFINADEWLERPGSVGRAIYGLIRICGEDGEPLPPRGQGLVYFEGGDNFAYHNDPEKTASSRNQYGWTSLGDIGWVDEAGYLYLTDRKSFTIISGGVNVYPQEIENHLIMHPKVADVAVIGAPDPDLGERVVAVVQLHNMSDAGEALATELIAWCRASLSGVKTPRQIDFTKNLPRAPTGKLFKRELRDTYWPATDTPPVRSAEVPD